MIPDNHKLGELARYVARRSQDDPNFDDTKLLVLLAFADFLAFGRRGESITGAAYVKLAFGPSPENGSRIAEYAQDGNVTPGVLSDDDMRIADEVVEHYGSWTAAALSEEAKREFTGWRMAEEGEEIRYGSVFLAADQTPSPRAIELGQRAARELGLVAS